MPASILLISADPAQQSDLARTLQLAGYALTTEDDTTRALADAERHNLLILDMSGDADAMLDLCRGLRQHPATATIPLLCIGRTDNVEERIGLLEVGADDVIGRPYDDRELEARVEALVVRFQRPRSQAAAGRETGVSTRPAHRAVAVYSPKGGVGTTTIATNLAVLAAASRSDAVLLIDMDLQFGTVAVQLDLPARQTIAELSRDDGALSDPELLRTYPARHENGLHVLPGPGTPEDAEMVTEGALSQILATAALAYEAIVVDCGSTLDSRSLAVLNWAHTVIIPFHPEIPALKAVHSLVEYLNTIGTITSKAIFVLNVAVARPSLRKGEIEAALGTKVGIELPYHPTVYQQAVNEGVALVTGSPRSMPALRMAALASMAFGEAIGPASPAGARVGGFLRRSEPVRRGR